MQNPSDVVGSWRACPSRPRTHKGSRGKSRRGSGKIKSGPVPTEELCGQEKTGNKFQPRRFRVSQGITHPRNPKISGARKIGPSVHWTIPSPEESRSSGIPSGATRRNVGYTPSIPCLAIEKVFEGTRGRACASRNDRSTATLAISGSTSQDSGYCNQEDQKLRSTDLQSSVEQTRSKRSYVGTRRRSEEGISPPI